MKNLILISFTVFLSGILYAQTPQKLNYQAVARDANGNPLKNTSIAIRLSVLDGSVTGAAIYREKHTVSTNSFGQFNVLIGNGTPDISSFNLIPWESNTKFLKVEMDPSGGINFTSMGTSQLVSSPYALFADKANGIASTAKINLNQISGGGAGNGQILSWNGSSWTPTNNSGGGGGGADNWGTQTAQTNATLSGVGTAASPLGIASQGATSGQVLKFNGTAWVPKNDSVGAGGGGSDNWGTQTVQTNSALTGLGTTANKLDIAQNGATNNQVLKWNGTAWVPKNDSAGGGADNWGIQTATTTGNIAGDGTAGNPIKLAQLGATSGQVLKWSGTNWIPSKDSVGDNWGTQVASATGNIAGDGSATNPLKLAQNGATSGQFLQWNGTAWVPVTASAGGDNWGTQTISLATNSGLGGDGTSTNGLKLAQQGATSGQFLQWNGTSWVPVTASVGGDNWGSQVTATNTQLSGNGTVGNPLGLAQNSATTGQIMQWNGTAWVPTTLTGDNWGAQVVATTTLLSGNGTVANPLTLGQNGATTGKVLKWNGASWAPANDSAGGGADNWGTQVVATNTQFTGNGTSVNPLKLGQMGALQDQILQWNGTSWVPVSFNPGGDNWGSQTAATNSSMIGNGTSGSKLGVDSTWLAKKMKQSPVKDSILTMIPASLIPVNGLTLNGNEIWLGGTLVNPTTITTSSNNTMAFSGLTSGAITDSIVVVNPTSGVMRRISPSRLPSGSGGSYTASNGVTLTGSNFTLGGTLTSSALITTGGAINTLSIAGLASGNNSDSIVTINSTNNILNRMSKDRINHWSKDANSNLYYKSGKVSIGTDSIKKNLTVMVDNGASIDTASIFISRSTGAGHPVAIVANASNSAFNAAGIGIRTKGGLAGIVSEAVGTFNGGGAIHYGVLGQAYNNNLGTLYGLYGFADTTAGLSVGARANGAHAGILGNVNVTNSKRVIIGFGFADTFKSSLVGYTNGANTDFITANIGNLGVATSTNTWANIGDYGIAKSISTIPYSIGVMGEAQGGINLQAGIMGLVDSSFVGNNSVYAGVFLGKTRTTDTFIANSGISANGNSNFTGNLNVVGMLSKGGGTFKIDHPQDPANKYLIHSFVESPDMMNIYNGNITTDKDGFAIVALPDYFYTLNKEFRYQLTTIGSFSAVMIKKKIGENNQFVIQTKDANVEVSWQVTGIRKDPFANANRIVDVVEKSQSEKGKYLHPELYNQPKESRVYYNPAHSKAIDKSQFSRPKSSNRSDTITKEIRSQYGGKVSE